MMKILIVNLSILGKIAPFMPTLARLTWISLQEIQNSQQHWTIPVVKPIQDEEGMSDEALFSDNTGNLDTYPFADFKIWQK